MLGALAAKIAVPAVVKSIPWKLIGVGLLIGLCLLMWGLKESEGRRADKFEAQAQKCAEARKADRTAYERGQADAAKANQEQVATIKAKQESVNEKARSDYQRDLAKLRAGGLRKDLAAPQSPSRGSPASPDGKTAPGIDDADKLPLPPQELLSAQEIELQLMHLQNWVSEQLAIPR